MSQPTLETERLYLRPFTLADVERVALLAGDRTIAEMTSHIPHPYTEEDARVWIETHPAAYAAGRIHTFAMVQKS